MAHPGNYVCIQKIFERVSSFHITYIRPFNTAVITDLFREPSFFSGIFTNLITVFTYYEWPLRRRMQIVYVAMCVIVLVSLLTGYNL